MEIENGKLVTDKLTGDSVLIVKSMEKPINEQVAKYDFNKNPITVYELEQDKEYECNPTDTAIMIVYPTTLKERFGSTDIETKELLELIENKKIKPYYFPKSRLKRLTI